MRKIINDPDDFVDEVVDGILAAYPGMLKAVADDRRALARADAPIAGHVGIVTGGGSGHLPLFLGYVGKACAPRRVGNVFSSPSPSRSSRRPAAHGGAGVLYLYGNYGGDVMNFDLAAEFATGRHRDGDGPGTDDVASAPPERADRSPRRRRPVLRIQMRRRGGRMGRLARDVAGRAQAAVASTRSMGVGLSPTILPAAGKPTFELGPRRDGDRHRHSWRTGHRRGQLETADAGRGPSAPARSRRSRARARRSVAVLVNGMGATPLEELYMLYRRAGNCWPTVGSRSTGHTSASSRPASRWPAHRLP